MQLLQITVTPMKCELQVEHARLEMNQDFTPSANVKTTPSEISIQSRPAKLQLDTYEARNSLGFSNPDDFAKNSAQKGKDNLTKYIRNSVETGQQMAKIEDGVTINQIVSQKMMEQPSTFTVFLPSGGANISWQPGELNIQFSQGSVEHDWQIQKNSMNYIPGSVRLNILQRNSIKIEYVGEPLYVPPSANPNYDESSIG